MRQAAIATLHAEPISGHEEELRLLELARERGCVPAIVVGRRPERRILSLDAAEVDLVMGDDENAVVRIDVGGDTIWAHVDNVARGPHGRTIRHVEMTRLPRGEVVVINVPVVVLRRSGGRWDDAPIKKFESVRIEGPVEMLPDVLQIDARRLRPHESITLGDLKLPPFCEPVDVSLDTPIVTILHYGELVQVEEATVSRKSTSSR